MTTGKQDEVGGLDRKLKEFVRATVHLSILRHDLCLEDFPPLVIEQAEEIVEDIWDALRGIGTCAEEPDEAYTALAATAPAPRKGLRKRLEDAILESWQKAPEDSPMAHLQREAIVDAILPIVVQAAPQGESLREWVECKETLPPTGRVVFITDGKDVGLGIYLVPGWKLISGHSMQPERWTTIDFPAAKLPVSTELK